MGSRDASTDARVAIARVEVCRVTGAVGFGNARTSWPQRRGLLVRLRDTAGRIGLGEASPLPGFSPDTIEQCRRQLAAFAPGEVTRDALPAVLAPLQAPAARFAVETALLDLLSRHTGLPVAALIAPGPLPDRIPVNSLITDPIAEQASGLASIRAALARGVRCVKVKLGRAGQFADELAALRSVRDAFGADLAIRLDANQAWTAAQASKYLAALAPLAPEYVEEPTADLFRLKSSTVPLAIDETASRATERDLDRALSMREVRAIILKPALLGGALACAALARRARDRGVYPVVSHLAGGPVELAACAQLALALAAQSGEARPCGLDRHRGLTAWPPVDLAWLGPAHIHRTRAAGLGVDPAALCELEAS